MWRKFIKRIFFWIISEEMRRKRKSFLLRDREQSESWPSYRI
jgi:hypothetical protein